MRIVGLGWFIFFLSFFQAFLSEYVSAWQPTVDGGVIRQWARSFLKFDPTDLTITYWIGSTILSSHNAHTATSFIIASIWMFTCQDQWNAANPVPPTYPGQTVQFCECIMWNWVILACIIRRVRQRHYEDKRLTSPKYSRMVSKRSCACESEWCQSIHVNENPVVLPGPPFPLILGFWLPAWCNSRTVHRHAKMDVNKRTGQIISLTGTLESISISFSFCSTSLQSQCTEKTRASSTCSLTWHLWFSR